jgi:hypothetical protein
VERIAKPERDGDYKSMDAVLRQAPAGIRQIYVLSAGSLMPANPEYVRVGLGVPAEIVRVGDIIWRNCSEGSDLVNFDHSTTDGVVSITVTIPSCANFFFLNEVEIANGRIHRNDAMSYELPDAYPFEKNKWHYLGRRMIVHVRPNGPARFVIEHGKPNGIAWFDTP